MRLGGETEAGSLLQVEGEGMGGEGARLEKGPRHAGWGALTRGLGGPAAVGLADAVMDHELTPLEPRLEGFTAGRGVGETHSPPPVPLAPAPQPPAPTHP